jgi:hypothetical protein
MSKAICLTVGTLIVSTIALAAGDIPTRYAGSFPSVGRVSNITGTFTGSTLALKYTVVRGTRFSPSSAAYTCTRAAPNKTRCVGTFRTDDGQFGGRSNVTVTWSNGTPVAMAFGKC